MYVNFVRDHEYVVDKKTGVRRRIPLGWTGTLDDTIAQAAIDAGNAVDLTPKAAEPAARASDPATAQTPAELLALADAVHFQTFRAEAAKLLGEGTPATKAEIVAALQALLAG